MAGLKRRPGRYERWGLSLPGLVLSWVAFAAPLPDGPPLVVDPSLSLVARGNVLLAARDGAPIPPGWAIGRDGRPTTDPARIVGRDAFDAHMAGRAEPADRITPSAAVLAELAALGARFGLPFPTGAERDEC